MPTVDILKKLSSKKDASNMRLDDERSLAVVKEWISTGCLPLDIVMGGGVPVGRVVEIYGDNSTGKSLLAAHIIAQTQLVGGAAVLYDTEATTSPDILKAIGVNLDELIYSTPDVIEDVFDNLKEVINVRNEVAPEAILTIVWDSIAATSSEEEMEKLMRDGLRSRTVATHARQLSTMLRAITRMVSKQRIAVVLINQTRDKIGVMFGDKTSTFGGKAIGFYATVRIELAHTRTLKGEGAPYGIEVKARITKNKVAPPFGTCTFPILFGTGIDEAGAIFWHLKAHKSFNVRGSWYTLDLEEGQIKFQPNDWASIYVQHQDAIRKLVIQQSGIYEIVNDNGTISA